MKTPFTTEEITTAIKKLKNGKTPGVDELKAEQLKYGPTCVATEIAEILNHTAKTGQGPEELKLGILNPLQKPGKKKGPCANLRPIILLSLLRKIARLSEEQKTLNSKINSNITTEEREELRKTRNKKLRYTIY